jgi:tetratricopeptide (TPR) repeat protein
MSRNLCALASAIIFSLGGELRAEISPALEAAIAPLSAGVAPVAIARLETFLAQNPSPAEQNLARKKLAEALVQAERPAEALPLLENASLTNDLDAVLLRAQALAALNRWTEALPFYEKVAADRSTPRQAEAVFGAAQALQAMARRDEAMKRYASLQNDRKWSVRARLRISLLMMERGDVPGADHLLRETKPQATTERNEKRFLIGQLNLQQGRPEKAIETLSVILKRPEGVSHSLLVATLFKLADAHLAAKTPEAGDDALEEFIDHRPNDPALSAVFAKLDELYGSERKPSTNELEHWAHDAAQPRKVLAQWYLARSALRSGDQDKAITLLTPVRDTPVRLPALGEANLELARLHLAKEQWDEAILAAKAALGQNLDRGFKERVEWLIAETNYRKGGIDEAASSYEEVAEHAPALAHEALFNAAVCWLRLDRTAEFGADFRKISNDPTAASERGELLLEEGTVQAAQGKAEAAQTFQKFIHDFPQSPRISEAWVSLAELAFHASRPDLDTARKDLARAREGHPTPAALERADYLEIWLEDTSSSTDQIPVITAANNFLRQHPDSHFTPEVRMKLAEAYFRRQDFANAQTQFELLAQQNPNPALTEKALFFAARSAMSSMGNESLDHALALLDQVVTLKGEMRWAARNEEAAIERRLGKNREALALYDEVLKNNAKPAELREALCGKGDIYYDMGATDAQNYRHAIEFYEQLASEPGVPAHWRNQAAFKKGKALEKSDDKAGALTTYYAVIEEGGRPELQHEFFWFYKAGFNAAHLLEEASDWKSAVAVYRKLAAVGGSRSEEAKARLTQLRLEHFLWDE